MNTGKSGGQTGSFAFTSRPLAGETLCGNCSPAAQPIQSCDPSPGTGAEPSPARRIGTRPVTNSPMVLASATSRFCTGELISAAATPACCTDCRSVQRQQPRGRGIAGLQIAHRHRHDRPIRMVQIADHRPMPGLPHRQHHVRLAADLDPLLAHRERLRPVGSLVFARAGRRLDENVLHVGAGGGEGPGDLAVMPQHQERHAGRGRARQHPARHVDAGKIPDAGKAERQMRIAGQQRRAGRGMPPVHRPLVRGALRHRVGRREIAAAPTSAGTPPRRTGSTSGWFIASGAGTPGWRGQSWSSTAAGTRPASAWRDSSCRQFIDSHSPIVFAHSRLSAGCPRFRRAQHQELRRGEPALQLDPGVHAARIGLQHRPRVGRQRGEIGDRVLAQAQRAHHPVDRQRRRPGDLRQPARCRPPHQLHLEHPVARMQKPQCRGGVRLRSGMDARHPVGVVGDVDRRRTGRGSTRSAAIPVWSATPRRPPARPAAARDADRRQHAGDTSERGIMPRKVTGRRPAWKETKSRRSHRPLIEKAVDSRSMLIT